MLVLVRPRRALLLAILAAVLHAGCMEGPLPPIEPDDGLQIKGVSIGGRLGSSCPPTSGATAPWTCEAGSLEFSHFDCDPPQYVLIRMGLSDPALFAAAANASTIRCEHTVTWSAMGRSVFPDTTVEATIRLNDQTELHSCVTTAEGSCSLQGTIGSRFAFHEVDETVELAAVLLIQVKPTIGIGDQFEGSAMIQKTYRLHT